METKTQKGQVATLTNPGGKILEVQISLQPKTNNVPHDPARFCWMPNWFAIDLGNGLRISPLGAKFFNGISNFTFNPNQNPTTQAWPTDRNSLFFAVPADVKDFTLTMPMAKGTAK